MFSEEELTRNMLQEGDPQEAPTDQNTERARAAEGGTKPRANAFREIREARKILATL